VVTKSGSTAETISSFMYMCGHLRHKLDLNPSTHFFFITDPEKGKLRELAEEWQVPSLSIPPGVGGRFSVFTPVGLLPAAILGINIEEMLDGAARMDTASFKEDALNSPAYMFAIIHWLLYQKGKPIHVLFPYANSLYSLADWFRQLWAESLGKRTDLDGKEVFAGPTPVKALGATDQHSQVQLYVEGPFDKVFTFMEVENFSKKAKITGELPFSDFSYLEQKDIQTLLNTEKKATEIALTENNRPNCTIKIPQVTPYSVGQLFYLFELATAFAGSLMHINPYDQPGVEHGKIATYALMGRKGFEEKKAKILKNEGSGKKYVVG